MTDIVIPLGTGSIHADIELRYCLRSVEKHLKNVGQVYLIGEKPPFITNINHVIFVETGENRNENIREKVLTASAIPELSDDFLFMNDDHFLLQDFDLPNFPNYFKGTINEFLPTNNGWYLADMMWTLRCLNDPQAKNFDTHTPIIYNKKRFIERLGNLMPVGYLIKSMYAYGLEGTLSPDMKIYRPSKINDLMQEIEGASCFSTSDRAINSDMLRLFQYLYPDKSKYEL